MNSRSRIELSHAYLRTIGTRSRRPAKMKGENGEKSGTQLIDPPEPETMGRRRHSRMVAMIEDL